MNLFIICDESNCIMRIDGVPMFGRKVSIPAIFFEEDEALDILFTIERLRLTNIPHSVHKVDGRFMAERVRS
jgi:hypothetical protein